MRNKLVLDTNILLLDANNLITVGKTSDSIVLPGTVLDEMDSKKSLDGELGYQARSFGRLLTKAEVVSITTTTYLGSVVTTTLLQLDETINIEVITFDVYKAQEGTPYTNDRKILEVASYATFKNKETVFMTNDVMAKLSGMSLGLTVQAFNVVQDVTVPMTRAITVPFDVHQTLASKPVIDVVPDHKLGTFNYLVSTEESAYVKLCTVEGDQLVHISTKAEADLRKQDASPKNAQQMFLAKAIQDPLVDFVICEALSGSGKTVSAVSNAIDLVKKGKYSGIIYIRNSVNDVPREEEVGFLSGNDEKVAVYLHPLFDSLDFIVRAKLKAKKMKAEELEEAVQEAKDKLMKVCNIQPMTALGLRGRTFNDCVVIIDEAQNASPSSMQKVLTRVGKGCKVIVIGSNRQIDNPYITKYNNGLSVLLEACTLEQSIRMHAVDLHKVVRSDIAEFAEKLFSKDLND